MVIRRWTLLTSHNRAEIDHIKLVFFQIRVENLIRGPPGFQFFVCFHVIRSEDQSQCRILSQRGPPCCAQIVLICGLDTKLYTTENRVDPSFFFNSSLEKAPALYGQSLLGCVTSEGFHLHIIISSSIIFIQSKICNYKSYTTINFIRN